MITVVREVIYKYNSPVCRICKRRIENDNNVALRISISEFAQPFFIHETCRDVFITQLTMPTIEDNKERKPLQ